MYLPEAFAERDPVLLAQFIDAFPLGLLITNELITNELITSDSEHDTQRIVANLLPFELSAGAAHAGVLRAHIARANPLAQTLAAAAVSAEVLAVFQGPQSYVSPGWYPGKRVHGKVVPTWNYTMVQARGRMRTIDDAGWLEALITRLTARHESAFASPWAPGDAPPDFSRKHAEGDHRNRNRRARSGRQMEAEPEPRCSGPGRRCRWACTAHPHCGQ